MIIYNKDDAMSLIHEGEQRFKYRVELNIISKFQLYLTGKITEGVELFGIGPNEIRAFGLLLKYHEIINCAVNNQYRVFVKKKAHISVKAFGILNL